MESSEADTKWDGGGRAASGRRRSATELRSRLRHPVSPLRRFRELVMEKILLLCGVVSTFVIILIFFFLFKEGLVVLKMVKPHEFLYSSVQQFVYDPAADTMTPTVEETGFVWQPASDPPRLSLLPLIWGSLGVAVLTASISTLAGIAIGAYLSEMASPRLRGMIKPALELLVGIPTVVIGFFMLAVLANPLRDVAEALGLNKIYLDTYNMFIGALGVSVVIIPVIASLVDDALRTVPNDLRAASLSLGATRWQTTLKVVLPAGVSGVFAAVVLGFGRALGETMIVLMCAGNAPQISANPFAATRTMTASIAAEMGSAAQGSEWYHALFFVGALLVTITFFLNLGVELLVNRYRKRIRL